MKTRLSRASTVIVLLTVGASFALTGCGKNEAANGAPQTDAAKEKQAQNYARDMQKQGGPPRQ